jgi:hypothetical protein
VSPRSSQEGAHHRVPRAQGEIELAAHVEDNSARLENFVIDPATRGMKTTWIMLRPWKSYVHVYVT